MTLDRRQFLKLSAAGLAATSMGRRLQAAEEFPVRTITRGPKFHWFGYYDKFEFDPTNRYVLSNEVDFEHRTPTADDVIKVGMVDLQENDKWIELGSSRSWGWQQGCMLQWRPGTKSEVVWNDREGEQHVCRSVDIATGAKRTIPSAIYTLSPDGNSGMTADFARIQNMRPGYGYVGLPDIYADQPAPADSGIFHVDMNTGKRELVLSLREISDVPFEGEPLHNHWLWFNHLLVSPDSRRFIALNRWRPRDPKTGEPMGKGWKTRMITANLDGSDLYVLDLPGMISHFVWRDPEHICMWTKPKDGPAGFYVVQDKTTKVELIGEGAMTQDGHNTYVSGHPDWILCDTYPEKNTRKQRPYLYHLPTNKRVDLGGFYLPPEYAGEWRCDLHPRTSRDGRWVAFDSPHLGNGRQVHLIDISSIVNS
ncbi:MAG TPA: twin-arginine translocation signal domain-containing protein [Planctomicrobium sp.]|nr:twin-arginine translocation signal domain-containing protein [Planctomicrobium sp.]